MYTEMGQAGLVWAFCFHRGQRSSVTLLRERREYIPVQIRVSDGGTPNRDDEKRAPGGAREGYKKGWRSERRDDAVAARVGGAFKQAVGMTQTTP